MCVCRVLERWRVWRVLEVWRVWTLRRPQWERKRTGEADVFVGHIVFNIRMILRCSLGQRKAKILCVCVCCVVCGHG